MYSFQLTINISAPVPQVWRALCDPAEVVLWDTGVPRALDAPKDYPKAGQHVRWRYRSRLWRVLNDRPQEVLAEQRLRSHLDLGPYSMDETYELSGTPDGCRIDLTVALHVRLPLVGGLVERLWSGPDTARGFEASLQGLKRHCETTKLG